MSNVLNSAESLRTLSSYTVVSEEKLGDISGYGIVLKHNKSGARVVVISAPDDNKVFSIGFRTTPKDSTGVPHILEHSVLCGSERFPVKEPFVELCKGSLNTFLNAMTYPDKTIYPVASCNDKDFANLMEVYLDAVLFPNIYRHKEIFLQEGWHYEMEDKDAPLTYNGVVYSEMKGAFSSPEEILYNDSLQALFPDTTYGVVSGGDPEKIPTLTYEQFLEFHKAYYHPVNSYIYLYGDMNVKERLEWMDREYLSRFERIELDSSIAEQGRFAEQRTVKSVYSVNTKEEAENASFYSYMVSAEAGMEESKVIALNLLLDILINVPGAPLKVALAKAGIGAETYGWISSDMLQPVIGIFARNASEEKAAEFRTIVLDTLRSCVKDGLNKKSLLAALNRMEFSFREADSGRTPKGLIYLTKLSSTWLYDDTRVFDTLRMTEIFNSLRAKLDTDYFEQLLCEELLENTNAVFTELYPQVGLLAEKEAKQAKMLAEYKAGLTSAQIDALVENTKALKEYQLRPDSPEALATIPRLTRGDIQREVAPYFNEEKTENGMKVYHQNLPTNKIAYVKLFFDMKRLSREQLMYAGILREVLCKMDTTKHTYLELNNEMNIHTGGVYENISAVSNVDDCSRYLRLFSFEGKALYSKLTELFQCISEMMFDTVFEDMDRLQEILKETKSGIESGYTDMAQGAANRRMTSYFSGAQVFEELTSGISFYEFVAGLVADFEQKKAEIVAGLKEVCSILFAKDLCFLSVTADEEGYAEVIRCAGAVLDRLKETSRGEGAELIPEKKNEGFKTPGQVQYVCCGGNFREAGFEYHGAYEVLRTAMSYGYLWNNVRVTGGAYGGTFYALPNGRLGFMSWRDPHLNRTMKVYEDAADYVQGFSASEEELTKYVIGTMSSQDVPRSPRMEGERGLNFTLSGNTLEKAQQRRNQIVDVTVEDIRALAPAIRAVLKQDYCCTIGSAKKVEEDSGHFLTLCDLLK